jgi:hypothetical protein
LLALDAQVVVLQRVRRDAEQLFNLADVVVGSCQKDAAFSRAAALLDVSVKLLLGHESGTRGLGDGGGDCEGHVIRGLKLKLRCPENGSLCRVE